MSVPVDRAARREVERRYRERKRERKALTSQPHPHANDWTACTGCGRKFPAGSLLRGGCGGEWCPSGAEAAG